MTEPLNILVIDDSTTDFLMLERHFKQQGMSVRCVRVDSIEGLKEAREREPWDLVLTDYNIPRLNFQDCLNLLRSDLPDLPVIMVSGTVGEEKAVEILKLGVLDFVLKDNLTRLAPAVLRALKEKKELQERRRTEERLSLALRGANDGLWDWNLKTNELYLSPRWKSMLGYADEELEINYAGWERLLHPDDRGQTLDRMRNFLAGRTEKYEIEFRMQHKEGHYIDILSRGFMLFDGQGRALRMVGTHVDITERKRLEEQLRQSQKIEAIGQLAGGVAHDFNNILTAIFGHAELILATEQGNETVRQHVQEIVKASQRAAALTQALLAFSRKQPVTLAVIDLNNVAKENETFLRRLIREDIEFAITCSAEPLPVLADRGQIEQVIMNLVANARDALPQGGRLSIATRPATLDQAFVETHGYGQAGEYALLTISDNGSGMDRETQSHIFEPFFTTKELGKGTGLGLSMAYGIIKKHDGFISVYSEPGTGTTLKIHLPRVSSVPQVDTPKPKEPVAPQGGTETILVCEDDATVRKLLVNILGHFGYHVIEAVDGQEAVETFAAHQESIDLVILDAIMPRKNGKVAGMEMKAIRPGLKTVFVSGYARDIFEEDNPFDENTIFINKPYSPVDLLARVRELLDRL